MKRLHFFLFIVLIIGLPLSLSAQASSPNVDIGALPTDMDDFHALRDRVSTTPEGGAALFVVAMNIYVQDQKLGEDMFTVALNRSELRENAGGYKGFSPSGYFMSYARDYLAPKPYLAASYILDTSPDTQYTLPEPPLTVSSSRNRYSEQSNGDIKVFVACSGADSPRPLVLRANNRGIWKVVNYNSLFVGIRKPVVIVDDDL